MYSIKDEKVFQKQFYVEETLEALNPLGRKKGLGILV